TETTADLFADIDPVGLSTSYHFEYGTDATYGQSSAEQELGSPDNPQTVSTSLSGLQPGLTYHFRVVATNSEGTTHGEDSTFNFAPQNCPNSHVRQQTGAAYLPDCRAYELVSPGEAGAAYILPTDVAVDVGFGYSTEKEVV